MNSETKVKEPSSVTLRTIPISPNADYMAGDDGNIYSRTRYKGFGRKEHTDWYPLKGHKNKKGYLRISLCHNNIKVTKDVHRLICMAFHGLPEKASLQVRHLDSNPANNRPSNLCWGTQAENWADRKAIGHGIEGEKHHNARFSDEERRHIKWAVTTGVASQRQVARILNTSQSVIYHICAQ